MNLTPIVELARTAHAGQKDLTGRDYFDAHLVPIAGSARVFGDKAVAAAWLHDILEDTPVTIDDLLASGVPRSVVNAVVAVTRQPDETYGDLIGRACADPLGCVVKLVDNAWNITSNPTLARLDPRKAAEMLHRKYRPARARLVPAAGLSEHSPELHRVQEILDLHHSRLTDRGSR